MTLYFYKPYLRKIAYYWISSQHFSPIIGMRQQSISLAERVNRNVRVRIHRRKCIVLT